MRRLANQVDERRNPRTNATVDQLLDRHFELAELEDNTLANYRSLAEKHIRPLIGSVKVGALDGDLFDSFYATLRRCREHCGQRQRINHRTGSPHQCDDRCKAHQCRPLSNGSVRYIHFILSGALKRAVRWRWIATTPSRRPSRRPNPSRTRNRPPLSRPRASSRSLAGPGLGHSDLTDHSHRVPAWRALRDPLAPSRSGSRCADSGEKHRPAQRADVGEGHQDPQHRRIALDPETLSLLSEHRHRCEECAAAFELALTDDAFVFSLAVDGSVHLKPDSVSQRYARLARR
ncbi:MAG: hypothetical protein LC749_12440, partial [Actinobacteria bacterium]|nr:hypothetical protein [Actinomycetota bacterium]